MRFWNEIQSDFKYNLVASYDSLQLNFEIRNNTGVSCYNGDGGIMIKVNFYDANDNIVHGDDAYIENEI